jgi:hypothetical protein
VQGGAEFLQHRSVEGQRRRKLKKHGPQLVTQSAHGPKETLEGFFHIAKSLDVGDEAVGLDRPAKTVRRGLAPFFVGGFLHLVVESGIDFDGLKIAGIVFEPFRLGKPLWIEGAFPSLIIPARCTDEHPVHSNKPAHLILQSYVPGGINSRVSDFFEAAKSDTA